MLMNWQSSRKLWGQQLNKIENWNQLLFFENVDERKKAQEVQKI